MLRTICDAWRQYKSRAKGRYYYKYKTDEERIAKRPTKIPLEEFKVLLQYWGDEEVQVCKFKLTTHILFVNLIILNSKANVFFVGQIYLRLLLRETPGTVKQ